MKCAFVCELKKKMVKLVNIELLSSVQGGCSHLHLNEFLTYNKPTLQAYQVLWDFWPNEVEPLLIEIWASLWCGICVHKMICFECECCYCCPLFCKWFVSVWDISFLWGHANWLSSDFETSNWSQVSIKKRVDVLSYFLSVSCCHLIILGSLKSFVKSEGSFERVLHVLTTC